jgi:hypothetical protein
VTEHTRARTPVGDFFFLLLFPKKKVKRKRGEAEAKSRRSPAAARHHARPRRDPLASLNFLFSPPLSLSLSPFFPLFSPFFSFYEAYKLRLKVV